MIASHFQVVPFEVSVADPLCSDAYQIYSEAFIVPYQIEIYPFENFVNDRVGSDSRCYIARYAGETIGMAVFQQRDEMPKHPDHEYLDLFAIRTDHRRSGYGGLFLLTLEELLTKDGVHTLELQPSSKRARKFYKREDYKRSEVDKTYMQKHLTVTL